MNLLNGQRDASQDPKNAKRKLIFLGLVIGLSIGPPIGGGITMAFVTLPGVIEMLFSADEAPLLAFLSAPFILIYQVLIAMFLSYFAGATFYLPVLLAYSLLMLLRPSVKPLSPNQALMWTTLLVACCVMFFHATPACDVCGVRWDFNLGVLLGSSVSAYVCASLVIRIWLKRQRGNFR